jgi:hypothetical protein
MTDPRNQCNLPLLLSHLVGNEPEALVLGQFRDDAGMVQYGVARDKTSGLESSLCRQIGDRGGPNG